MSLSNLLRCSREIAKKKGLWRLLGLEGQGEVEEAVKRLPMDCSLASIWSCVSNLTGSLEAVRPGEAADLLGIMRFARSALPNLEKYSAFTSVPRKFIAILGVRRGTGTDGGGQASFGDLGTGGVATLAQANPPSMWKEPQHSPRMLYKCRNCEVFLLCYVTCLPTQCLYF